MEDDMTETDNPTFYLTDDQWAIVEQIKRQEHTEQRVLYQAAGANLAYLGKLARAQTDALEKAEDRFMSDLRDRISMCVVSGMLAHPTRYHPRPNAPENWHDAISQEAYEIADAMIAAREVKAMTDDNRTVGRSFDTPLPTLKWPDDNPPAFWWGLDDEGYPTKVFRSYRDYCNE
jgi:hypothetical protein